MRVSLFSISFIIAVVRAIGTPALFDSDLFASIPSNSQNIYGDNENSFVDESSSPDSATSTYNDPLIVDDGLQWLSEEPNNNMLLGLSEAYDDEPRSEKNSFFDFFILAAAPEAKQCTEKY